MSDRPDLTEHAIEVSMADAMNKAWEVRARKDLTPAARTERRSAREPAALKEPTRM